MKRPACVLVLALGILVVVDVHAQDADEDTPPRSEADPLGLVRGFGVDLIATSDSERFERRIVRASAMPRYDSPNDFLAISASTNQFRQEDWALRINSVVASMRKVDPATAHGVAARLALSEYGGHGHLFGEGTWNFPLGEAGAGELIAERDVVESRGGLTRGLYATFGAVSVNHTFGERATAILMPTYRRISDGNEQPGFRAWLIYLLVPEQGLAVNAKIRSYTSTQDGGGAYFSPDRYERAEIGLRWRRRLEGWRVFAIADIGRERIGEIEKPTAHLALTAEHHFANDAALELQLAWLRASDTESDVGAPSAVYTWRMARVYFAIPF